MIIYGNETPQGPYAQQKNNAFLNQRSHFSRTLTHWLSGGEWCGTIFERKWLNDWIEYRFHDFQTSPAAAKRNSYISVGRRDHQRWSIRASLKTVSRAVRSFSEARMLNHRVTIVPCTQLKCVSSGRMEMQIELILVRIYFSRTINNGENNPPTLSL